VKAQNGHKIQRGSKDSDHRCTGRNCLLQLQMRNCCTDFRPRSGGVMSSRQHLIHLEAPYEKCLHQQCGIYLQYNLKCRAKFWRSGGTHDSERCRGGTNQEKDELLIF
jgi:hypothetical protein